MDKKDIKAITIEDFKTNKDLLDYCDNDVIVIQAKNIPNQMKENIRLDCFLLVYCFQGELTLNINGKDHRLNKENSAVLLPGTIIHPTIRYWENNSDNAIRLIGFSSSFLKDTIQFKKEMWGIAYRLYQNPILPCGPKESYKFYLYKEMAYTLITEQPHLYRNEILKHFFAAIFCEMLSEISKLFPKEGTELSNRANRGNWIFRKFIELVMKDDGSHRSVAYYADKLCYSPKHLSTVIRQVSGRSPLSIINAHAIQQIKIQLERSDKTMKELTDEFNFANPSFFGKFVKQHMGMPPQQYRQFHHSHKS